MHLAVLTYAAARWIVFRIETNSMLCLPPSPFSEIQPPLWSELILYGNLPNHESEPRGKTGIVKTVTPQPLPFSIQAFSMGEVWVLRTIISPKGRRSLGGRTMCTTLAVLTTIALILRQHFSNKIKPWVMVVLIMNWCTFLAISRISVGFILFFLITKRESRHPRFSF